MNANSMTSCVIIYACVGRYLEVFDELLHALLTGEEDNKDIYIYIYNNILSWTLPFISRTLIVIHEYRYTNYRRKTC